MRFFSVSAALLSIGLLSGCGYVHFGRLPKTQPGDPAMAEAYANLSTEHKILKQELALARKEGETLRGALDHGDNGSPDLVKRLNETTRELATLRASYSQLQTQRGASPAAAAMDVTTQIRLTELEEKLAASMRNYTQLQEENARLRRDLTSARSENASLADRLTTVVARNEEAQGALAQLNTELLAQKDARARAEQTTTALRAQLSAVMARIGPADSTNSPVATMTGGSSNATPVSGLQLTKAPAADAPATAELRISPERLRASTAAQAPVATAAPATPAPEPHHGRVHVVQAGDTLEKIARKYYGAPEGWSRIYAANNDLLRDGRPLKAGMELEIPE
jgi:nucleoid-associated protein YgaU